MTSYLLRQLYLIKTYQVLTIIWENQSPDSVMWENKTVQPFMENSLAVSQKLNTELSYDLVISHLNLHPKEYKICKYLFITLLFTTKR